jgi:hypothetical protein
MFPRCCVERRLGVVAVVKPVSVGHREKKNKKSSGLKWMPELLSTRLCRCCRGRGSTRDVEKGCLCVYMYAPVDDEWANVRVVGRAGWKSRSRS